MKAIAEFRVREPYAKEFLLPEVGKNMMDLVRIVRTPVGSNLYKKIGELYELVRIRDHNYFFFGWAIHRVYSKKEIESAELLLLKIMKTFEPAGLECGTIYDSQGVCEICGSGIQQISELILDLNTVPKNIDIARTISNEIIVSQRLAKILVDNNSNGYELKPINHKLPKYQKKPWYQLVTTSLVDISPVTKTGNDPFDDDKVNEYRCRNGHTIGLNILSELSINKDSWDGSDLAETKQLLGVNRGLLRTYPLLVISQKLYRLMKGMNCKGFDVEVVRLVV
ncbi:MAG: hypothetical protein WCE68_09245 [Anaerolineales bacterium]